MGVDTTIMNPTETYDIVDENGPEGECPTHKETPPVQMVYDERIEDKWICPDCGRVCGDEKKQARITFRQHVVLDLS